MLPWSAELAGRFDQTTFDSAFLRDNPLGDPHERPVLVYLPPGYDESDQRYPSIYVAMGYTGHSGMWFNRTPFRQPYPELLDAMFATGDVPPAIVVFVDAWTRLGGSQYLDSPGTGRYHSYLCDEIVPYVDARYRTIADRDHRAITGKSSGGYAAMVTPLLRPDVFGALATHAGDAAFEVCYQPEFPLRARQLRDQHDGSYPKFFADFESRVGRATRQDLEFLEMYGYAAAYSAEPDGTVLLPYDDLGQVVPEIWERWLSRDPVRMVTTEPRYAEALRSLRAIWVDAGRQDEYYLDLGAAAFHRAALAAGVPEERLSFELFEGGHGGIEYRYPLAVGWLSRQLTG
ncbi:alpha/beta hydrolase [Kribbella sp. CA-293567]|uniref:alpha/beta hydrolase n=1 Tax=Kribbella sp. CA-293567 TaxID=3002436 RepID=UPI0022DDE104|nr:alpha/beta hydrolase-fold protein [Kribbella sp. CA-293567]WBQ04926.1 alpha/beta hydrolase-fold protein [Kribbella sp. CA-293567]